MLKLTATCQQLSLRISIASIHIDSTTDTYFIMNILHKFFIFLFFFTYVQ
jgi:hypothetical protein